jgi:hypothetical protein
VTHDDETCGESVASEAFNPTALVCENAISTVARMQLCFCFARNGAWQSGKEESDSDRNSDMPIAGKAAQKGASTNIIFSSS